MARRRLPPLRRRQFVREPKRKFMVFCEGENTEPAYFRALQKACSATLIELELIGAAGVPFTIATRAVKSAKAAGLGRNKRKARNSFERHDEVWAVFDRDNHEKYLEAVQKCEAGGVGVCRSNPCFELWLILHEQDYEKPGGRHQVQDDFAKLRPEYGKAGRKLPDCSEMVARVEIAEARAERQLQRREREGAAFGDPSTTVFELTRAIRKAAEEASKKE